MKETFCIDEEDFGKMRNLKCLEADDLDPQLKDKYMQLQSVSLEIFDV